MSEEQTNYITETAEALDLIGITASKQIIQEVSGFVPVFEALLEKYDDHITALVFGRRWQYCRMEDGVCRASLETLAKDLKLSKATVMRHTDLLVRDGYLIDLTPDARNIPHLYADAGKIIMKSQLTATVSQRNTGVSQRNATVSQSHLIKDSIKQRIKNQEDEGATQNVFTVYTQEIGLLTPMIADSLEDWEKEVGPKWVCDAIREAAIQNKRGWKYCLAILNRWKAQGNQEPIQKPARTNGKASTRSVADDWLARKERELANGRT